MGNVFEWTKEDDKKQQEEFYTQRLKDWRYLRDRELGWHQPYGKPDKLGARKHTKRPFTQYELNEIYKWEGGRAIPFKGFKDMPPPMPKKDPKIFMPEGAFKDRNLEEEDPENAMPSERKRQKKFKIL